MKKPKRPRFGRRQAARKAEKLARDREKLAALEPGGSPERPLEVQSASLIEPRARGEHCLRCDATVRVAEHEADEHEGRLLRVVVTQCVQCGARRTLYFRIVTPLLN